MPSLLKPLDKQNYFPYPKALIYRAGPWVLFTLLQTLVLHRLGLNWQVSVNDAAVSTLLMVVVGFSTDLVYRYYQPGKEDQTYRVVFGLVMAILFCVSLHYLPGLALPDSPEYVQFLNASMPVRFVFAVLVIFFITLLLWIRSQLTEQKEMDRRKLESEQLMKEAELARLRQQLHPHFLFNSLNSINALIGKQPEAARTMTQQLSDFLRGTLKQEDQLVRLKDELVHLCLYLEIEKVRFGSRLEVQFVNSPESLEQKLPALLLQPIVENAIKFGLYDLTEAVLITVNSAVIAENLLIEISNPFDPVSSSGSQGLGFGLQSIQRRLQLIYARQDLLSTSRNENKFTTTLKIPVQL